MGIQYSSRKVQPTSQALGPLAVTVTNTERGVHGLVSQERQERARRLIAELVEIEWEGRHGMSIARMDSIREVLVYVSKTYRDMKPCWKGVNLIMDSWIPYRDEEVLRLIGEELNMEKMEGKWEVIEDADKPIMVMGVPRLKFDLLALGRLTEYQAPPRRQLRVQRQSVAYLMGDTSGLGFGLVLWCQ